MDAIVKSWDSKSLLLKHLAEYPASVVVGRDTEAPRGYYSCSLECCSHVTQIGIVANQQKAPSLFLLFSAQLVLVGYDQFVSVVDLGQGAILESILLEGIFYEYLYIEEAGLVLALHELGCMAFSGHGKVIWRYIAHGILVGWRLIGSRLELTMMDSRLSVILGLEDGALA